MQPLQQKDAQGRPVMPPNVRIGQGEVGTLQQLNIGFVRPIYKTGLQLKKAPEVPWVYTAFVLIIVGAFACLPAQRQIWGATCDKETSNAPKWYLGGKTNKGQWTLNQHFETLLTKKEELTL